MELPKNESHKKTMSNCSPTTVPNVSASFSLPTSLLIFVITHCAMKIAYLQIEGNFNILVKEKADISNASARAYSSVNFKKVRS